MMALFGRIASLVCGIVPRPVGRWVRLTDRSVLVLAAPMLVRECAGDELVLFNSEKRSVYLLNHTAAAVIRLTDGSRNLGRIARTVARDFDADEAAAARDIKKIYRNLMKRGALTMAPDRSFIPALKQETVIREEDDGAFVFDPIADELSAVNETGLLVLRRIDGKKTLADIIDAVAAEFPDAEPDQVARDVEAFVDGLVTRGLIVT